MREAYDGWFVVKVSDPEEGNTNIPMYSSLFEIKSIGAYSVASADNNSGTPQAPNKIAFKVASTANGNTVNVGAASTVATTSKVKLFEDKTKESSYNNLASNTDSMPEIEFASADMNYDVLTAKEATDAGKTTANSNIVIKHAITIHPGADVGGDDSNAISDIHYTVTDTDGNEITGLFTVEPDKTVLTSKDDDITVLVAPADNLTIKTDSTLNSAKADKGYNGIYTAYLHISHAKAFGDEFIVRLSFVVGNDTKFVAKLNGDTTPLLGILDSEKPNDLGKLSAAGRTQVGKYGDPLDSDFNAVKYAKYQAGGAFNPYAITSKKVGTTFDDIKMSATGGAGSQKVSINSTNQTKLTGMGLGASGMGTAELTISGALKQAAYHDYLTATTGAIAVTTAGTDTGDVKDDTIQGYIADNEFQLIATDSEGTAVSEYFIIVPDQVDSNLVSLTIGNDTKTSTMKYGSTDTTGINAYTWLGDYELEDVADDTRTLTIKNDSAVDLTFATTTVKTAETTTEQFFSYTPALSTSVKNIKVEAGKTATIVVAPKAKTATGSSNTDNTNKDEVTFEGDALQTTSIGLNFSQAASAGVVITKPTLADTILPVGEVGVVYAPYTFECETSGNATTPSWSISDVKADGTFTGNVGEAASVGTAFTASLESVSKLESEYGLTLSTSGVLSGTPKKAGFIKLVVDVSTVTTTTVIDQQTVYIKITAPTVEKGIVVTSGETNISQRKALTMDTVKVSAEEGSSSPISIKNVTGVDMDKVVAKIVKVEYTSPDKKATVTADYDGSTSTKTENGTTIASLTSGVLSTKTGSSSRNNARDIIKALFKVEYSEDDELNEYYAGDATTTTVGDGNGIKILKNNGVTSLKVVSIPSKENMPAGTYVATIKIANSATGTSLNDALTFKATLVVEDAPELNATAQITNPMTVGTALTDNGTTNIFNVTYSKALGYTFAWETAEGSDFDVAEDVSGLKLTSTSSKAVITGTPKKAGTLKVKVTATAENDATITVSKVFTITINGTVTITSKVGTTPIADNDVYVLPGFIKNGTATETTVNLENAVHTGTKNSNFAGIAGTGLTVTVEDAEDDRPGDVKAKSDITNIYAGSKDKFTVTAPTSVPAATWVATNPSDPEGTSGAWTEGTTSISITPNTTEAGEYKAKVSITGNNITKRVFYVYLVVSDELSLNAPVDPVAVVGTKTHIEITATGTKEDLTWSEVGNINGDTIPATGGNQTSQIAAAGFTVNNTNSTVNNPVKGTDITELTTPIIRSYVINGGVAPTVTTENNTAGTKLVSAVITDYQDAAPTKKGTYPIFVKASAPAANLDVSTTVHTDGANFKGNITGVYLAQQKVVKINLTVNATEAVKISTLTSGYDLTGVAGTQVVAPNTYDLTEGMTKADISGIIPSKVEEYTIKSVAEDASGYAGSEILVGITNASDADINAKFTINTEKFTLADATTNNSTITKTVASDTTNKLKMVQGFTGAGTKLSPYTATLTKGYTNYLVVKPVATLKAGTYVDTLTVSSDDMNAENPVTLKLTFVIADKESLVNADFVADTVWDTDAETTYTNYVEEELTAIATKNVATGNKVELTPYKYKGTPSYTDYLFIRNSGNSAIATGKVSVEEVTSTGATISSTSDYKLVTAIAAPANTGTTDKKTVAGALPITTYNAAGDVTAYGPTFISIAPKNANTIAAGSYDAYLKITVTGGTPESFIVPVHFTVLNELDTISHTPTADTLTLTSVAEGYASEDATGGEFVVTNTAAAGEANVLTNLMIVLGGADGACFKVIPDTADKDNIIGGSPYIIKKIAPGASVRFKVVPEEGLPAKDSYTASVTVSNGNLKNSASIQKTVSLKVTTSTSYSIDEYSRKAVTVGLITPAKVDESFARRLYTSLVGYASESDQIMSVVALTAGDTVGDHGTGNNAPMFTSTDHYRLAVLDLDENGIADTDVWFYGDTTFSTLDDIDGVIVTRRDNVQLPEASYTISGITNTTPNAKYFTSVTFNQYSLVTFYARYNSEFVNATAKTFDDNEYVGYPVGASVGTVTNPDKLYTGINGEGNYWSPVTGSYVGSGSNGSNGNEVIMAIVPNGSTAASMFGSAGLPVGVDLTKAKTFSGWMHGTSSVLSTTKVDSDADYVMSWRDHTYPGSTDGNSDYVTWTWEPDYKQCTVTIKCVDTDCPDADKGAITLSSAKGEIIITPSKKDANCVEGERWEYKAVSTKISNGAIFTDTQKAEEDKNTIKGHKYEPTVTWTYNTTSKAFEPAIKLVCTVCKPADNFDNRTVDVPTSAIVYSTEVKTPATCEAKGEATYTITSFTAAGKTYTPADEMFATYTSVKWVNTEELPALGHKAEITYSDLDKEAMTVKVKIVCNVDNPPVVLFDDTVKVVKGKDADDKEAYIATVKGTDGVDYTVYAYDHVHQWTETWGEWTKVGENWTTTLNLTCTVGGEVVENVPLDITSLADGDKYIDWTAKATYDGQEYTSTVTIDAETGEITSKHEHAWKTDKKWTWDPATGVPTSASLTFTCTVGDKPETKTVTGSAVAGTPDKKGTIEYTVEITGPDGNPYKTSKKIDKDGNEKPSGSDASVSEGEISVSFAVDPDTDEEGNPQFVFTGAAIKPALVIRDEDRDVTLAEGVDYTLKWATNKAVGTAVVTVIGKGNYAGKSVTLSYKIADLKLGTDDFAVKKIKGFGTFTNGTDTGVSAPAYDGNAWTPEEITVTDASGADVVLKLQADGTYASEDGKSTAISIANNVNKGSATVSALNAKGKVVKKTFKIAAANLAAASDTDLTFDPDDAVWAAKGAIPATLNVEYKGIELVQGQDYTVKYSYASKTKDAGEKAGKFIITGKKNFAGKSAEQTFDITALELADDAVSVSAFAGTTVKKIVPTVSDGNGAKIAPKALSVTVVKEGETTPLDAKTKLVAGDKITVTVKGVNETNISDSVDIDITVGANLGKAKVVSSSVTKYYTGEAIELTDEDMEKIAVTINKTTTLKYGEDFEIAGYQNNVKKGSMLVTIRGIGDKCSGSKTFKVKIAPKTMKKAD